MIAMFSDIETTMAIMYAACACILGACFGSFAGVVIYRVPLEESIVVPRSYCAACTKPLQVWHNLPIISWILLKGRCGYCKAPIGKRSLILEIIMAVGFLALYVKFGFGVAFVERAAFLFLLICLTYIDLDTLYLPISLLTCLYVLGMATTAIYFVVPQAYVAPGKLGFLVDLLVIKQSPLFSWYQRLLGAMIGFASLASINVLATMVLRRIGRLDAKQWAMGFGDAVLFSAIGLFVGASYLVAVLFIGSFLGSVFGIAVRMKPADSIDGEIAEGALPYGPFLAIAAIYVYLF